MNQSTIFIYMIIFVIMITMYKANNKLEPYSGLGALIQLYSKGPQDRYLTKIEPYHYFYSYYPYPYSYYTHRRYHHPYVESLWNNPTRIYPYYRPLFPFYY